MLTKFWIGRPEGKRHLGKPGRNWMDNGFLESMALISRFLSPCVMSTNIENYRPHNLLLYHIALNVTVSLGRPRVRISEVKHL
jgi:hypothetical protein